MSAGHFEKISVEEFEVRMRAFPFRRQIDSVHMHHTWRPTQAQYRVNPAASILGMYNYHVKTLGWADIAQHISIGPDGEIWTGRDWNMMPASSTGFNGTAAKGPFMFEMIGDFDQGQDPFGGAQKAAVLRVIKAVQERFRLPVESLRFHNQMAKKTCPGSAIDYANFLKELAEVRSIKESK